MTEIKKGAASAGTDTTHLEKAIGQTANSSLNIAHNRAPVKWGRSSEMIRYLIFSRNVNRKEIIEEVQNLYPKFDKTCLSKIENGKEYGFEISKEALKALYRRFAPDVYQKLTTGNSGHKLSRMVACRLDEETYQDFMQKVKESGFGTKNDCLVNLINEWRKKG